MSTLLSRAILAAVLIAIAWTSIPSARSAAFVQVAAPKAGQNAYPDDAASVQRGRGLFDRYCAACHNFETAEIGPNLAGVTARRTRNWLVAFVRNAPAVIARGDETAMQLQNRYKQFMPPFPMLRQDELDDILGYVHTFAARASTPFAPRRGALADPVPEKIAASGLTIVLERVLTFPPSAAAPPVTRINKLLTVADATVERLFVHDLRGKLYEITGGAPRIFMDVAAAVPRFIDVPGLGTGFGSFAFHPDFAGNGLLYTTHTEPANSAPADFAIPAEVPVRLQWVLEEWKTPDNTRRELLRVDMHSQIHGVQEITFNPLARRADADYGMLYVAVGDGGAGVTRYWPACCDGRAWGAVLRIDPAGTNGRNGKYGVPPDNPFVATNVAPPEVWARGFRNPHRISWDLTGSGKMLITDIGQTAIEEVNLGAAGAHYGWPRREGTFATDLPASTGPVYARPPQDPIAYTYPVAQYDHDEGNAISGGFVYGGSRVPLLSGKYVFGDIMRGRVFVTEIGGLEHGRQARIEELAIEADGRTTDLTTLTRNQRVDLRFGQDAAGELYIFTKADGVLWKIVDAAKRTSKAMRKP